MIFEHLDDLKHRIETLTPRRVFGPVTVHEDTTSYMGIEGGSVLRLAGNDYFILGDTREGRFGIDDQPKYWVKYAVDLSDGSHKIIKLVFHEQFATNVGMVRVRCTRSPDKESEVLSLVRNHPRFMQGFTGTDPKGNKVRVIDFIRGKSIYQVIEANEGSHEQYWHEALPSIMKEIIPCVEAIGELHALGQHHGDIRNDHIFVERDTGRYIWIDFDFDVNFSDYDVWSMGNVLTYVIGMGMHTFREVSRNPKAYPLASGVLDEDDALVLAKHRIANLRKLFPYIPEELNAVLLRFSMGTSEPYEDLAEQARDLRAIFG